VTTGAYFASLDYRFYVAAGTSASSIPTSASGLTEVLSLTNAGIQGQSDTQDVVDYGSTLGFKATVITGQGYSIPCTMNLSQTDAGYIILKTAAKTAASGAFIRWFRTTPVTDGSADTEEIHAGISQVSDFSEDIQAGNISTVTFTLTGYGSYNWTQQGGVGATGIASLTRTAAGAGLSAGTAVPLVGGTGYGATVTVTVSGGAINGQTIINPGTGYTVGDVLTILSAPVVGAGDTLPTFEVASLA